MFRRSNQQEVGHFGAKHGEAGVGRCKSNFNTIWYRDMGLSLAIEIVSICYAV